MVSETALLSEVVKQEAAEGKDRKNEDLSEERPSLFRSLPKWADDDRRLVAQALKYEELLSYRPEPRRQV